MMTAGGKEIKIKPVGSHYVISMANRLPEVLSGIFTSEGEAEIAVGTYLANKSHNKNSTRKARNAAKEAAKLELESIILEETTELEEDK